MHSFFMFFATRETPRTEDRHSATPHHISFHDTRRRTAPRGPPSRVRLRLGHVRAPPDTEDVLRDRPEKY